MPVSTRSHSTTNPISIEEKVKEDAMTDKKDLTLADLLKAFNTGNAEIQSKLKSIEDNIKANQKVVEDYIRANDENVKNLQDPVGKLELTVKTLETTVTNMSDEMEALHKDSTLSSQKI